MSYSSLSSDLQNVLLVNHHYISKWFLFFVFSFLSFYYLLKVMPCQEKTKSFYKAIMRIVYFSLSLIYVISIPLTFVLLTPETDIWSMYSIPLSLYLSFGTLFLLVYIIRLLKTGLFAFLNYIGLDMNDPEVNKKIEKIRTAFGGLK